MFKAVRNPPHDPPDSVFFNLLHPKRATNNSLLGNGAVLRANNG